MVDTMKSFRLPGALWRQVEAAAEALRDNPELALHGRVTAATVLRLALAEGLPRVLERYGATPAPPEPDPAPRPPTRPTKPRKR